MSGRQAAHVLAELGLNLTQAQQILRTGLAGEPVRTTSALLYDGDGVLALAARRRIGADELHAACPHGLVVVRLWRDRPVNVTAAWSERAGVACGPWDISLARRIRIRIAATRLGGFPLIATVCGFVVLTADIQDLHGAGPQDRRSVLDLAPPGEWHATFTGRRLPTGRGPGCLVSGPNLDGRTGTR